MTDAMNDKAMEASMERIHNLYMDREKKPLEKAAWWVEYVCRNKGGEMLRSRAEDMPWYQYHHVDIALFLSGIIFSMIGGFIFSCKICFRFCCSKKVKTE